jgi:formylmethanofuran dehydrogenase subunit E
MNNNDPCFEKDVQPDTRCDDCGELFYRDELDEHDGWLSCRQCMVEHAMEGGEE